MGERPAMADPRQRMQELQRMADRVCVLILSSDLPAIDIEIEKNKVREWAKRSAGPPDPGRIVVGGPALRLSHPTILCRARAYQGNAFHRRSGQ
jgi:hypothetical protein